MGFQIENGILEKYKEEPGVTDVVIPDSVTRIGKCAFRECNNLTHITIPENVTSIGNYAFQGCGSLTNITIPESVTFIGIEAFEGCKNLTGVVIPESITRIGEAAFYGCEGLANDSGLVAVNGTVHWCRRDVTDVTIPESVTSIGGQAFNGCGSLTSVTIPNGVTRIGNSAFEGCKNMTSVTIPESVTSIGSGAFYRCGSLTSVAIPEGVTSIGDHAFWNCENLTVVTIPESVTRIEGGAFWNCKSLTSVTIPEGVTSIGSWAFAGCRSLTSVSIPKSVEYIENYAFNGCSSLTSVMLGGTDAADGSASPGTMALQGHAFTNCFALKHITLANLSIDCQSWKCVFEGCNFVDRSAQVDVTVIGRMTESTNDLLYRANGVARIFSPDTPLSEISAKRKAALAYLETPNAYSPDAAEDYCKYIAGQPKWALPYIFRQDRADLLEALAAKKNIKASNIDQMYLEPAMAANALQCVAFLLNWKGTHVTRAQQDKLWERELMKDPYNREDMAKLWSWEKLDDGTLRLTRYKGTDTHVEIPDHIGTATVSRLDDLFAPKTERGGKKVNAAVLNAVSSVAIPDSITVHSRTFRGCKGLADQNGFIILRNVLYDYIGTASKVTIPHGVVAIDRAFGNDPEYLHFNHKLRQVEIPETVVEIGAGAFRNCVELKKVILHTGLQRIGAGAFDYCRNLTDIVLPDSVTEVGEDAFMYCKSLTSIVLPEGIPSLARYVFGYCESLKSVTIPKSVTTIARSAFSHCRGFVICAPAGSYAETYAKKNSIPFQALD